MRIFQLELTNYCNAQCPFCIRTTHMTRTLGYMSPAVFDKCLRLILDEPEGPGRTVNLHNMGESLLHPLLDVYVRQMAAVGIRMALSTNGILLTQRKVYELEEAGLNILRISVDAAGAEYRYDVRGKMVLKAHAVLPNSSASQEVYRKGLDTWGGQMELEGAESWDKVECSFLHDAWRAVLWDGTVVTCCLDVNGEYPLGNVFDRELKQPGMPLCDTCHGYRMKTALVAGNYTEGESDVNA